MNGKQKWIGLNIPTTRGNKRKAEAVLNELIVQYSKNPSSLEKVKFTDYIEQWLRKVKDTVDIVAYEGYFQYATKHIIPYFKAKNLTLQEVKITDIEGYYHYKSVGGRLDGKPGGLSLRSIKLHGVVLNLVMKEAVHERLITDNPCIYAKYPTAQITVKQKEAEFYTVSQCNRLLEVVRNIPLYEMVYLTFMYGLRRSELLGLKWDAIDFDNETIAIQHTVVLQNEVIYKDKTKNASSKRTYPLLPEVKKLLENMLEKQKEERTLFGNCYQESGYVFVKEDGTPYYPSYPSHELQKVLKKFDLPHIRWHDLRHSCASMLIEKGWHLKDISEWLGHSNISTTANIYCHVNLEHKRSLGKSLNGLLYG